MIAAKNAIEKACRVFMDQDDTDPVLTTRLEDIKRLKSKVGDRISIVGKELNIIRNMFRGYENR